MAYSNELFICICVLYIYVNHCICFVCIKYMCIFMLYSMYNGSCCLLAAPLSSVLCLSYFVCLLLLVIPQPEFGQSSRVNFEV